MVEQSFLSDHFLIAMPGLKDPNFTHSVTYICEHTEAGALGLVINRVSNVTLSELLEHLGGDQGRGELGTLPVMIGGPVQQDRGFVLHTPVGGWDSTLTVGSQLGLTTSKDVLVAMARGEGPDQALVTLGYAGWGAGQLEREMAANAWLAGPADPAIMFLTPVEQRWRAAAALLGVEFSLLAADPGHA
jgi:putative transcriptional regulator